MAIGGSFYREDFMGLSAGKDLRGVFLLVSFFTSSFFRRLFWAAIHRPSVTSDSNVNVGSGDIKLLLIFVPPEVLLQSRGHGYSIAFQPFENPG
jgi:hypothetical protein